MNLFKKNLWVIVTTIAMLLIFVFTLEVFSGNKAPLSVKVSSGSNVQEISAWYDAESKKNYFFLPSYANSDNTEFSVEEHVNISIGGKQIKDGDKVFDFLEAGKEYSIKEGGIFGGTYKVAVAKAENVSTMYVNTSTGSMKEVFKDKKHEEPASVRVFDVDGTADINVSDVTINGRGNSTWTDKDKKPFTLKFGEKQSILGMGRCSKWVLLANAKDKANIKNKLVFDMADMVDLPYTPDNEYTMLYLNGEFYGLFLLCQSPNSMGEIAADDGKDIVLCRFEYKGRVQEMDEGMFVGENKLPVERIIPKSVSKDEEKEMRKKLEEADISINSEGTSEAELNKHIDVDSWVKRYLIEEIVENYDGGIASYYIIWEKGDTGSPILSGPLWDYDNSLGGPTTVNKNPAYLYLDYKKRGPKHSRVWYSELMANADFHKRVTDLYEDYFSGALKDLTDSYIPALMDRISDSVNCDGLRWGYEASEANDVIIKFLEGRKAFLDSYWIAEDSYYKVRYLIDDALEYRYAYVPCGSTIFDSAFVDDVFNDKSYSFYEEASGEKFDITQAINEDINLVVHKAGTGGSGIKKKIRNFVQDKDVLMVTGSMLVMMLIILGLLLKERIGGAGKK